jgi:hypothetical protein
MMASAASHDALEHAALMAVILARGEVFRRLLTLCGSGLGAAAASAAEEGAKSDEVAA